MSDPITRLNAALEGRYRVEGEIGQGGATVYLVEDLRHPNETGREEVYVRPFPDVESGRTQVSTEGGSNPLWAHNSNELFYFDDGRRVIDPHFETGPQFRVTEREPLFDLGGEYLLGDGGADFYDISPDDQRFLIGRLAGATDDMQPPHVRRG